MPKRSKDPIERVRRKLAEAQLELHLAQERRLMALAQGEREIREAQQRAVRRTQKATERLEKRAGDVARAEARLYTLTEQVGRLKAARSARKATRARTASVGADLSGTNETSRLDGQ